LTKPSKASKFEDMAKAIKDFWLTHNTLPKESHAAAAASGRVHARTTAFDAKPRPPNNGASRKKWNPVQANK